VQPTHPQHTFYTSLQSGVAKELANLLRDGGPTSYVCWGEWDQSFSYEVAKEVCGVLQTCKCCARHQTNRPVLPAPSEPAVKGASLPQERALNTSTGISRSMWKSTLLPQVMCATVYVKKSVQLTLLVQCTLLVKLTLFGEAYTFFWCSANVEMVQQV
jgi:hypothetical protein